MPTPSNVHVDALLSNVANKYTNRRFIAPQTCPVVSVTKDSGLYWIFGKERFEAIDSLRAPKTEAKLVDWAMTQGTYHIHSYALADMLSNEELENADQLNLRTETVELLTDLLYVGWERRMAAIFGDTGTFAHGAAGYGPWDTDAGDPLRDLENAADLLPYVDCNTAILSKPVWNVFRRNPRVLAALGSNERKTITLETARELTGISNILIGESYYNTAQRGRTPVLSRIWADTVWLGYINMNAGSKDLTAVRAFRRHGFQAQNETDRRKHSEWHEVSYEQGEEVVCSEAGYIITGVLTA